jgi:hypothetical protein
MLEDSSLANENCTCIRADIETTIRLISYWTFLAGQFKKPLSTLVSQPPAVC